MTEYKRCCGNCEHTDGIVYTSLPPQVRCELTGKFHYFGDSCDANYDIPAADVQPVVHGKWIKVDEQPYFRKHFHTRVCSVCRMKKDRNWNYCPNCGAKMDGEENGKNDTTT